MENVAPELEQPTQPQGTEAPAQLDRRTQIMIIGGAILVLVLLITAIVLMAKFPSATTVIRDIAIVFVAVETFLIGIAVLVLSFQIQALIQVLQEEIQPLLRSVNDTASTVRGTTEFVSDNVVSPFIKMAGFTAAARQVFQDVKGVTKATRPRSQSNQSTQGGKRDGREA